MKQLNDKTIKRLTYKDKTRIFVRSGSDIFYRNFFDLNDAKEIVNRVLKDSLIVDNGYFLGLLNHSVSFAGNISIDLTKSSPGKSDEKNLLEKTCKLASELSEHLHILLNQYGPDTYKLIPIFVDWPDSSSCNYQKVDTYDFLHELRRKSGYLSSMRDIALSNLENKSGKKTGNNSNNPSYQCIYQLVNVYKIATGKDPKEHFKQTPYEIAPFGGEFYEFVHCVFKLIAENYAVRYPESSENNPFLIELEEGSHVLGSLIRNIFEKSKDQSMVNDIS